LNEVNGHKSEYVPGLLVLSIARSIGDKRGEAKNHLKILAKKNYSNEYAD